MVGIVLAAGRRKRARVPSALVAAASLGACLAVIAVPSSAAETPPSFTHRVVDADLGGFLRRTVAGGFPPAAAEWLSSPGGDNQLRNSWGLHGLG